MVNLKYSDLYPLTSEGGNTNFATLINTETTLTDTGYYYSNSLASDTNINAGSLTSGKQILWFNDSANDLVFSGLTSVDGISIPVNKGVKVNSSNYIEFTVNSAGVITKNRGFYTIDWLAGQAPSTLTFNYVSGGDTNGIVYYLGATKYNASFVNPVTRGEITVAASSVNGTYTPNKVFGRTIDNGAFSSWFSTDSANNDQAGWLEFNFNNHLCRVNRVTIATTWVHDASFFSPIIIEAWDGNAWVQLFSGTSSTGTLSYYDTGIFANPNLYSKYRYKSGITGRQVVFDELECYGELAI